MIKHLIVLSTLIGSSSIFAGDLDHCYTKVSRDACVECIDDAHEEFLADIRVQEGYYDVKEAYDLALEREDENKSTENQQATDAARRKLNDAKERVFDRLHDLNGPDVKKLYETFGDPNKPSTDPRNACEKIVAPKRERPASPTPGPNKKRPTQEIKKPQ